MYGKANSPTSRYASNRGLLGGQPQRVSTPRPARWTAGRRRRAAARELDSIADAAVLLT